MQIADSHAHVFPQKIAEKASASIGHFYEHPICHVASMDILTHEEEAAGISYFCVSSSATDAEQVSHINDFIASCIKETPNAIGLGSLFPTMKNWEAELERMQEMGLQGIKIHSDFQKINIDEPLAVEMYRGIAKAGFPVLFHMGDWRYDYSSPQRLSHLISMVPDLIAVAAHFGGWQSWEEAYEYILPENVYYDTSSALMYLGKERGLDYLEKLGSHRFLFGSDFPMWNPKTELERFLDLEIDSTTQQRILFDNFKKLYLKAED